MNEKVHLTLKGLEELKKEHEKLLTIERPAVIEELKAARALGDLSENADYDVARDRQAKIEASLREMDYVLSNYILIDETNGANTVRIGSNVTILNMSDKKKYNYDIVGSVEADPLNGKLSNVCLLGEALIGKKVDDVVEVKAKNNYNVKII